MVSWQSGSREMTREPRWDLICRFEKNTTNDMITATVTSRQLEWMWNRLTRCLEEGPCLRFVALPSTVALLSTLNVRRERTECPCIGVMLPEVLSHILWGPFVFPVRIFSLVHRMAYFSCGFLIMDGSNNGFGVIRIDISGKGLGWT